MNLPTYIIQDDPQIESVRKRLERGYKKLHPAARIDVYKRNESSIRIRVIDPDFEGKDFAERDTDIWKVLEPLPEETYTNITMLVLITPKEKRRSPANLIFEDPPPSQL